MSNKKHKQFHVVVGGQNGFIIRSTNKHNKVQEWIDAFIQTCAKNTFIQVFQHGSDGVYDLILNKTDKDVPKPVFTAPCDTAPAISDFRPVGFGRW